MWIPLTHEPSFQSLFVSLSTTKLLIRAVYHHNLLTADTATYVKTDMADSMTS